MALKTIRRSALLSGAADHTIAAMAAVGTDETFERRATLFEQGARAEHVWVVARGRVRLQRHARGDRMITLAYWGPGELVGDTSWADGVHVGEGQAAERVEAVRIPMRRFTSLACEDARLAMALSRVLAQRVRDLQQRMEALLTRSLESRAAEFLLDAATRFRVPDPRGDLIAVKFTHQEIASYIGSTRETVTLLLGDLKRRGMIAIDHRRIIVRDRTALEALV